MDDLEGVPGDMTWPAMTVRPLPAMKRHTNPPYFGGVEGVGFLSSLSLAVNFSLLGIPYDQRQP